MDQNYEKLFNNAPVAYFILDVNGAIKNVNETGCKLLSDEKSELLNKSFSQFIAESNSDKFLLHLQVVFLTFESQTCELFIKTDSGKEINVQLETVAQSSENGGICWCVVTDISGRMRIFENLKEDRIKLEALLNNSNDIVLVINSEFKIIEANKKAVALLEYAIEDMDQLKLVKVFKSIKNSDDEFFESVFMSKRNSGECLVCKNDGSSYKSEFTAIPHYSKQRHILIIRDFTLGKSKKETGGLIDGFLKTVFANLDIAVIAVDRENKIKYANSKILKILSVNESVLIEKNWFEKFVASADRVLVKQKFDEAIKLSAPGFEVKGKLEASNGNVKYFSWNYALVKTDNTHDGAIIFGAEITECIKAKEELKNVTERFFKSIYSASTPIVITQQSDDAILYVNDSFLKISGFENTAQIVGKSSIELNAWKNKEQREQIVSSLSKEGSVANIELALTNRAGEEVAILYSAFLLTIDGENCIHNSFYDISKRKRAEELLRQNEAELRALFENVHDAIIVFSTGSPKILDVNPHACSMYGYSKEEFLNLSKPQLFKDQKTNDQVFAKLTENGNVLSFETTHLSKDKREMFLEINAAKIKFKGVDAVVAIARDITERKNNEEKIISYIEELENTNSVIEKNAEELKQLNEQLKTSEDKLRELNENKDKFFSIIAHDLRSPFASLLGFAEYLYNEFANLNKNEMRDGFENIYRSARGVFNLLDNLLQWSRIQTGKIEFHPSDINLNDKLSSVLNLYAVAVNKKNIHFNNDVDQNIYVFADGNMVETILRNLVSNAIKFSEPNSKIWINAEKRGNTIEVTVEDEGIGMSNVEQKNIFNIGKNKTTLGTLGEEGTGLGLILCKEFIERNCGELSIESKLGAGSKFKFTLPIEK